MNNLLPRNKTSIDKRISGAVVEEDKRMGKLKGKGEEKEKENTCYQEEDKDQRN